MKHLFLTALIVERLWKHFANFVGIKFEGLHLEQLIKVWWRVENNNKLKQVYRAILALIIWELWKRRNTRKNGGDTTLKEMVIHIESAIHQMIRALYTWLRIQEQKWADLISTLERYKPQLHHFVVKWELPITGRLKCTTDRATRGNPRLSFYEFCIRDHKVVVVVVVVVVLVVGCRCCRRCRLVVVVIDVVIVVDDVVVVVVVIVVIVVVVVVVVVVIVVVVVVVVVVVTPNFPLPLLN
ncbi:hypothetical protein MTR67_018209 [Solanum verrucosum]|uniref:Uncharacterized protein n=1 Tax=Solanum verrucosum TaxID=315347 RepID=A0AAF0QJA9_SOLVR|nr:hypothetical protein MTR67_018209 [Solanum verrucosum]